MRFTFAKNRRSALIVDIGRNTDFHKCVYFITIIREYYNEDGSFDDVKWIKGFFRK